MFSINEFRTSIDKQGILRSNKYFVEFALPEYLRNSYSDDDKRLMSLRCENVAIPGMSFLSTDSQPRFGYGPVEKMPYVPGFDPISLTFILDSKNKIYKLFYDWTSAVVGFNGKAGTNLRNGTRKPYEVGYKNKYKTDLIIRVYDGNKAKDTSPTAGKEVMLVKLYAAFPMGLPSTPLAWDSTDAMKLSIPFSYTDFEIAIP